MHLILVGSASTGDTGGIYSSSYSTDYMPRGSDVSLLEILSLTPIALSKSNIGPVLVKYF